MATPTEKKHLTARTFEIAAQCANIRDNYRFRVQGLDFIGLPGVLSPALSPSTAVWKAPPVRRGDRFLEIGCGTGVFSVIAALSGASGVTAVDINPHAVANTRANAELHGVADRVLAYESDIFRGIPAGSLYDLILWNIPWSHTDKRNLSVMERATFDPCFVLLERYLSESPPYLAPGGRLLVGYSSTYGNMAEFDRLAALHSWKVELLYRVGSENTFFAELFALTRGAPGAGASECAAAEEAR